MKSEIDLSARGVRGWFGRLVRRIMGRPAVARAIHVTLWGKPDCSLCDKAHLILDRLGRDYRLQVTSRDITQDAEAFQRFRYVIPVVEIAGGPRFEGKISEHRLRQAFEALLAGSSHTDRPE